MDTASTADQLTRPDPITALRERFARDLFDDWLPFVRRYVIDPDLGGFPCAVWPDGRRDSDVRATWYEGRGLWVFAHLYDRTGDIEHLRIAERSFALLERSRPDGPSGRTRILTPAGDPRGEPDPEVYSDLFVAEGLAAFASATDNDGLWQRAAATVEDCERRLDEPGYRAALGYVIGPDGSALDGPPGVRPLGVWMLLIRVATELLRARHDADLERRLRGWVAFILDQHLNPRFDLFNEAIGHDLRPGGPAPAFCYLGHAVETLWMIMDAALDLRDEAMYAQAARLFRRHVEVARDPVHGGLFRALIDVDQARYALDKTLWVQLEAMIGMMIMVEHDSDAWATEQLLELDHYVRATFPYPEPEKVVWREYTDRTGSTVPDTARVENYHVPRALIRLAAPAGSRLTRR